MMIKLKAAELRLSEKDEEKIKKIKRNQVYIILDNVIDTYNIGAIFRLADAVAAEKVLLCGETETPPNSRIKKASINTTEWVPWEYYASTSEAIWSLRKQFPLHVIARNDMTKQSLSNIEEIIVEGSPRSARDDKKDIQIVAIEQAEGSVRFDKTDYQFPIALIVGHETYGVSEEVLKLCDKIVEIPMFGVNVSLNVMVSLGIVLYEVIKQNTA